MRGIAKSGGKRAGPRRAVFCALALVAALYLLSLAGMEKRGFWVADNAGKFLQLQAIIAGGYRDYSLPWPGRALDPDFAFNPLPAPFSIVRDGRLFSQYPPLFALVSALPFRWFGFPGLYVLPLLSSLLLLGAVAALARATAAGAGVRRSAVLIAGLCTPLWFYAVEFWEHASAVCLCLWAVHLGLRFPQRGSLRDLVGGGLLLAGAVSLREETVLFAAVLSGLVVWHAPGRRRRAAAVIAASLAVGLAPLLIFQGWALGAPFGFHVRLNLSALSEHLAARSTVFYRLLVAAVPGAWSSLAITGPFVLGFLWGPTVSARAFRVLLPLCGLAGVAAALALWRSFLLAPGPIAYLLSAYSLFPAAPVLALALVRCRDQADDAPDARASGRLRTLALGFVLLYGITAPAVASAGIHWGNRFLLVLYPLLAVLAAANLACWRRCAGPGVRWLAWPLVSVVLVSFTAQVYSIHLLRTKKDFTARVNRELARHPEAVVVTNVWWAPLEMYSAFYERQVFFVHSQELLDTLSERLRCGGYDRVLFVTGAGPQPDPAAATVEDGGLGSYSLAFTSRRL